MSDEKVLTKEIAEQYLADDCPLNLEEFTTIDDAAAESLSKHWSTPWLNALAERSDVAAKSLSKHEGDLNLNGLTELSDAAAAFLSEFDGLLHLDGLSKINAVTFDILVGPNTKYRGGRDKWDLSLKGLSDLSADMWQKVARFFEEDILPAPATVNCYNEEAEFLSLASVRTGRNVLAKERMKQLSSQVSKTLENAIALDASAGWKEVADDCAPFGNVYDSGECNCISVDGVGLLNSLDAGKITLSNVRTCSVRTAIQLSQLKGAVLAPKFSTFSDFDSHDVSWHEIGNAILRFLSKVHGVGPRCRPIAGRFLEMLFLSPEHAATGELARIERNIKYDQERIWLANRIRQRIDELGVSRAAIEDFCMDDHGIRNHTRTFSCDGETFRLRINQADVVIEKKDGRKWYSTKVSEVKKQDAEFAKELQAESKSLSSTLKDAQQRLEWSWLNDNSWKWGHLQQHWFEHPVVSHIAQSLIWRIDGKSSSRAVLWHDGGFVDSQGKPVKNISSNADVQPWHPADSPKTVRQWRQWMVDNDIVQPIKQAFREVYLVTEAERASGHSSSRFAGHILRQKQFAALCRSRGWSVSLVGPFDSKSYAKRKLQQLDLTASILNEPIDDQCGGTHLAYVRTGTLDFSETIDSLPPKVFSEIMRDMDLFVSVSSIGIDPNWTHPGPDGVFTDYWSEFTSSDLQGASEIRRETLEMILPAFANAERFSLDAKHLCVKGELGEYQIHLQSGAVFMSPGRKHICIIPKKRQMADFSSPLPGDQLLPLIVSKALLLVEDTKIKDKTILSQIKG